MRTPDTTDCDTCCREFDIRNDVSRCPNDKGTCIDCCTCSLHIGELVPGLTIRDWVCEVIDDRIDDARRDPHVNAEEYANLLRTARDARRLIVNHT